MSRDDDRRPASGAAQRGAVIHPSVTVRELLGQFASPGAELRLRLATGGSEGLRRPGSGDTPGVPGLDRLVQHPRIQKSGLALAGHHRGIVPSRLQILGQTEQTFLATLDPSSCEATLQAFFGLGLSCVVLTDELDGPTGDELEGIQATRRLLVRCAEETGTALLLSAQRSSRTIAALHAFLDDRLAPRTRLHGVLVDVFGIGLLLRGASGIGKSECALDLVMRGHRLVADDIVECDYRPPGMVFGAAPELLKHHIEVRGLGILDVRELFGVTATRPRKRIDVVARLVEWTEATELDRLGLDDRSFDILGVAVRELLIPVRPGRDVASIVEVAARSELSKNAGHHAAREFFDTIEGALLSERSLTESSVPPPVRRR